MHTYTKFKLWLIVPLRRAWTLLAAIFLCATLIAAARPAGEPPTTFGNTIGPGLLCIDQIDPFYYWSYLNQFFGPPYKKEGGAYWFKVQAMLWGANLTEVLVSDGANDQVFLAASFKEDPAKLSAAIEASAGVRHINESAFQYSPHVSAMGSKIVYSGKGSRIYCAKFNLDFMRHGLH
jgi:hypothetical protein